MEREPDRRSAFLTEACSGDGALRTEVEALLLAHENAGDFLQNPVLNSMEPVNLHLPSGTRLGLYEVSALIGAGGMGEVYRARDTRLGRDVAIKVLPAAYSADAERLRRFEQEARAASVLNHPNILTVHDIGSNHGAPYIVSELLEGQT